MSETASRATATRSSPHTRREAISEKQPCSGINPETPVCVQWILSIYTQNRTMLGEILEKCPAFQKHVHEIAAEQEAGKQEIAPAWKTNEKLLESRLIFDFEIPEVVLEKLSGKCGIPLDAGEFGRNLTTVAEGHFKEGNGAADWIEKDTKGLEAFGKSWVLGRETKVHAGAILLEGNDFKSALEFIERDGDGQGKFLHGAGSSGCRGEPAGEGLFGFDHEEVLR